MLFKKKLWLKAFFFIGTGAGAGQKNTPSLSQSKMDQLRNYETTTQPNWIFFEKLLFKSSLLVNG